MFPSSTYQITAAEKLPSNWEIRMGIDPEKKSLSWNSFTSNSVGIAKAKRKKEKILPTGMYI